MYICKNVEHCCFGVTFSWGNGKMISLELGWYTLVIGGE